MTRILVASYLLLLETPVGELDLVREEVTPGEEMPQLELGPERLNLLLRDPSVALGLVDLDNPMVVRVAVEPFEPIRRDFVLVVDFGDRSADVVRVELLVSGGVVEDESGAVENGRDGYVVFGVGDVRVDGRVLDEPEVVVVAVRVQGDLLFYGDEGCEHG
jgi:hypothetical protein